jgi:hypothetical protein
MDDFDLTTLNESRNEWVTRLLDILTPNIIDGFNSMFNDALQLCIENSEEEKYLMTYQNFLTRIPNWNNELIENECKRIVEQSKCSYIQDLITCVHVIQLKALTCIRVGYKQKQIDIDIPELESFVHKIYIRIARKLYSQIYLFETDVSALQKQKYKKEFESLVKNSILSSIRDSIPIEKILRNYLEESTEEDLLEYELEKEHEIASANIKSEIDSKESKPEDKESKPEDKESKPEENVENNINIDNFDDRLKIHDKDEQIKLDIKSFDVPTSQKPKDEKITLKFNNVDSLLNIDNKEEKLLVPKDITTLEKKYEENHKFDHLDNDSDDDEQFDKLSIGETINTTLITPVNLNKNIIKKDTISLSGIEVL